MILFGLEVGLFIVVVLPLAEEEQHAAARDDHEDQDVGEGVEEDTHVGLCIVMVEDLDGSRRCVNRNSCVLALSCRAPIKERICIMDLILCRIVVVFILGHDSSNASRDAVEDNFLTMRQSERVGLVCQSALGSITLCPSDFARVNRLVKAQSKAELLLMVAQKTSDCFDNGEVGAVGSVGVGNFDFRIVAFCNIVL